jgi:hypothetical protein
MAGINGLVLAFRSDANKRVYKYSVMTKATDTTQTEQFAALPGGANAVPLGVTVEHFTEPPPIYSIGQPVGTAGSGTNYPENVTGTTPTGYDLTNKGIDLQVNGVARCLNGTSGTIHQGDILIVADAYGRVKPLAGLASGTYYYAVGYAQNTVTHLDDVVQVLLAFFTGTA